MKAVLPALARPLVEPHLPAGLDVHWFTSSEEALGLVVDADIGWLDNNNPREWARLVAAGAGLKWLSTIYAGLDALDTGLLRERGTRVTNGSGVNAHTVAEYAVMGALVAAKRFDQVVRAADRHEWPTDAPGKLELFESKALVIGYGTIGRLIGERLEAFGVEVTGVTRSGADGTVESWLKAHFSRIESGDYAALLAYIDHNDKDIAALQKARLAIRDTKRVATCVGFGPRFQHSTGQAYKGGPNTGVFVQITADDAKDLPVPGQTASFGIIKAAQARGDFDVLTERDRRALRLHIKGDVSKGLAAINSAVAKALS